MLRLKSFTTSPSCGFIHVDQATGWRCHSWSFNGAVAQWFQECSKRKNGRSLRQCQQDVEQHTCGEIMKTRDWQEWLIVDTEYRPDDYLTKSFPDRENSSPRSGDRFVVVMPFCVKDIHLALKLAKWMAELGPYDHEILISHDYLTSPAAVDNVAKELTKAFSSVKVFGYSAPRPEHWPPTIAFREAANKMQQVGKPWLWLECDCVPLKKGWLDKLQQLYWNCGKAFAGPIVKDLGHCNGTAIYPANTPKRIPRALSMTRTAWDVTMMVEMIHDCANLHPYWFHAWGTEHGKLHPYLGEPPVFRDSKLLSQIPPEAVIFHRDKSLSLIDRLREKHQQPTTVKINNGE